MLRNIVALLSLLIVSAASSANAAVTVFPVSVFSQTGVTNAGNALGAPSGVGAVIDRNNGVLVLEFSQWLDGSSITLNLIANGLYEIGSVTVGHVNSSGVATFAATSQNFLRGFGAGPDLTFDLSTECATVSALGCNLVRITGSAGFFSASPLLDGVTSSAPEPAVWSLLILAFVLTSARLKQMRRTHRRAFEETGILSPI